ncbi:hypothetical protein GCM10011613_04310 [Cellvibrio zantedeschiae]|uniref:Cobalt transporter n=1 Tax=Cellvibrio zantedeschiae TaxID=1237077 RepID=A0ABQ3AQ47_9GAMM|nr:hypothetical protein [Cellvibrio zantedeschiae]GGY63740.1 hypothetical protein GCM10011613_04310 [Cellvibrio zantedeschiae]
MRSILNHKALAFATLIIWLLASWSGAHGHMCFDGQEPPMTVHIHTLGEHADHDSSQNHLDADVDIGQLAPAKPIKIDLPILLLAAFLLAAFFTAPAKFVVSYFRTIPHRLNGLRPPLRAPPVLPA